MWEETKYIQHAQSTVNLGDSSLQRDLRSGQGSDPVGLYKP